MGPPGSGKTMLAQRLPSILPELTDEERLQTAQIYSAAGEQIDTVASGQRPFRHPHHSISHAGLLGGGNPVRPGEVSLAHNGVCFLDEISQFSKATLQGLRQPMEDGRITIVRAGGAFVFPARFMLVAASNPCPCGFYGDPERTCICTLPEITAYQGKLGGPLLDRIDLQIDVWRSDFDTVVHAGDGISSGEMREGVTQARAFRSWRMERMAASGLAPDGDRDNMPGLYGDILARNGVDADAEAFLREMARIHSLSGRGIVRTIGVARTISDMGEHLLVDADSMAEALAFRLRGANA
jgi:magnesium chelatase family protein